MNITKELKLSSITLATQQSRKQVTNAGAVDMEKTYATMLHLPVFTQLSKKKQINVKKKLRSTRRTLTTQK